MSDCPNQTVNQTVTVNVGDGCCDKSDCCNYATVDQLTSSIAGVYSSINNSMVTPANLSTLSTSIGVLSNDVTDLSNEFYTFVETDFVALEQTVEAGLSSLSTAIGAGGGGGSYVGANISTIRPDYSTLLFDLSTVYFKNTTHISGNLIFDNPLSFSNINTTSLTISNNSNPIVYFSTSAQQVPVVYPSSALVNIPITPSLSQIDFIISGANGLTYETVDEPAQYIYGGLGAWLQGTLMVNKSMIGSTLELNLPSVYDNYNRTSFRIVEGDTILAIAGNGGEAGDPADLQNIFGASLVGDGGNAGSLTVPATDGISVSTNQEYSPPSGFYFSTLVLGGGAGVVADGIGGLQFDNTKIFHDLVNGDFVPEYGDVHVDGSNASGGIGGRGGKQIDVNGGGGDGGGGYYGGGGGGFICNTTKEPNIFAAGGGGGSSWINTSLITNINSGLNDGSLPAPLNSIITNDANAYFVYTTNEEGLYGGLKMFGPDGTNMDINCTQGQLNVPRGISLKGDDGTQIELKCLNGNLVILSTIYTY